MKSSAYIAIKWIARLSIVAFLVSSAVFWSAYRCGIIKFACMQPGNHPVSNLVLMLASPASGPVIDLIYLVSTLMILWMVAELKFKQHLPKKTKQLWKTAFQRWYLSMPVCTTLLWYLFDNKESMLTGIPWIGVTFWTGAAILIQPDIPDKRTLNEWTGELINKA